MGCIAHFRKMNATRIPTLRHIQSIPKDGGVTGRLIYPLPPSFIPLLMGPSLFKTQDLAMRYLAPSFLVSSVILRSTRVGQLSRLKNFQHHFCLNWPNSKMTVVHGGTLKTLHCDLIWVSWVVVCVCVGKWVDGCVCWCHREAKGTLLLAWLPCLILFYHTFIKSPHSSPVWPKISNN